MNLHVRAVRLDILVRPQGIYHYRIREHMGQSIRTNKQLANSSFSAVRLLSHSQDHKFSDNDFSMLHRVDIQTSEQLNQFI